jgi:hypothetical protein
MPMNAACCHYSRKVATMAKVKSQKERHFPVTQNVFDQILAAKLTAAEWRLYTYLCLLDPFGDVGVKYNAEEAMVSCGMSQRTYFTAKAKFVEFGLFSFVDGTTKVLNLYGSRVQHQCEKLQPDCEKLQPDCEKLQPDCEKLQPDCEKLQPDCEKLHNKNPESMPEVAFESPHTLSNLNQTNLNSLTKPTNHPQKERENFLTFNSETNGQDQKKFLKAFKDLDPEEREKFLAFSKRKADQLPKPPTLIQKWIERNFKELYESFMRSNLPPQISRFENFESTDPNNQSNYDPEILNTLSLKLREAYVIASDGRLQIDSEGIVSRCEVDEC